MSCRTQINYAFFELIGYQYNVWTWMLKHSYNNQVIYSYEFQRFIINIFGCFDVETSFFHHPSSWQFFILWDGIQLSVFFFSQLTVSHVSCQIIINHHVSYKSNPIKYHRGQIPSSWLGQLTICLENPRSKNGCF